MKQSEIETGGTSEETTSVVETDDAREKRNAALRIKRSAFAAIDKAFRPTSDAAAKRANVIAERRAAKAIECQTILAAGTREAKDRKGVVTTRALRAGETVELVIKAIRCGLPVDAIPTDVATRFEWETVREQVHAAAVAQGVDPRDVLRALRVIGTEDERVVLSEETETAIREAKPKRASKRGSK